MCQNAIYIVLDIKKITEFHWKNADVGITREMYHVIHIFFGSSLGKV